MKPELTESLVWAGAMLGLALALSVAHHHGLVAGDLGVRTVAMNGLVVAWYANRAPKARAPSPSAARATRRAAWLLVAGGLVYAGCWAFAPLGVAATVGTGVLAASVAVSLVSCRLERIGAGVG